MSIGDRVRAYRRQRGLSQAALGGLVGRSEDWVSKVERGILPVDRLSVLLRIAEVLHVRDVSDLTGRPDLAPNGGGPVHDAVPHLRRALALRPGALAASLSTAPLSVADLTPLVADAWTTYDTGVTRYADLAPLLPNLLGEAHRTLRNAPDAERRPAAAQLVQVYQLLQVYLRRLGERDLARVAADRALTMSEEHGDRQVILSSTWCLAITLISRGEVEEAHELLLSTIDAYPLEEDAGPVLVSLHGALHLAASIASARCGGSSQAWHLLREADHIARRNGSDRNDWRTSFGPTNVAMHAVHLAAEEGDAREALRLAEDVVDNPALPLERRTRYQVELVNGYRQTRQPEAAILAMQRIRVMSPEELGHHVMVRETLRDLLRTERASYRREVRELASAAGVLS